MSKPICFVFAALSIGLAPSLGAQGTGRQTQVTVPQGIVARTAAVKPKSKAGIIPRPSASQRAPDPSKMVVIVGPNGERRVLRQKKQTK